LKDLGFRKEFNLGEVLGSRSGRLSSPLGFVLLIFFHQLHRKETWKY